MKGILNIAGRKHPVVVLAVQQVMHPPVSLAAWPDEQRKSTLVFITRRLARSAIENRFASLVVLPSQPWKGRQIGRRAYFCWQWGQIPLIRKSTSCDTKPSGSLTRRGSGTSLTQVTESQCVH